MRIVVSGKEFKNEAQFIVRAVGRYSGEIVTFSGFDDTHLRINSSVGEDEDSLLVETSVRNHAPMDDDCVVGVNVEALASLLPRIDVKVPVVFTVDDDTGESVFVVSQGDTRFQLDICPGESSVFPRVDEWVEAPRFATAVNTVAYASNDDEQLPLLGRVSVGTVEGVTGVTATDRFQLAHAVLSDTVFDIPEDMEVLLPADVYHRIFPSAHTLEKMFAPRICFASIRNHDDTVHQYFGYQLGVRYLFTLLETFDTPFPQWNQLVSFDDIVDWSGTVNVTDFRELLTDNKNTTTDQICRFTVLNDILKIVFEGDNGEKDTHMLPLTLTENTGQGRSYRLNTQYILNYLKANKNAHTLTITTHTPTQPILLHTDTQAASKAAIMPMRP